MHVQALEYCVTGEALRVIGRRLGIWWWNFSVDPCAGDSNWVVNESKETQNYVKCNCSVGNDSYCHVTDM